MTLIKREQVPEEDCWDLSPMYQDTESWIADFKRVEKTAKEIIAFQGSLRESAAKIREAFCCYLDLSRSLEKLYVFAHLNSDVDTSDGDNLGRLQQVEGLYAEFSAYASYLTPELLAIEDETLASLLASPELTQLRRMLEEIVRFKPHTLSAEEENLLALGIEVFGTSRRVFSQLNNADLSFGEIEVEQKKTLLSHATFILFLKNSDRSIREQAFKQYYTVFDQHKNTIAATLTGSIKKDIYLSQARKFGSCLENALFADNISPKVYDTLIDTISAHLEPLHRYYHYRKETLSLDKLQIYDTYCPLVDDIEQENTFERAVETISAALSPLGEEYVETLLKGLTKEHWADCYENKGKRSGAYSSGCYDSPPYMLLNFKQNDMNSVFTLAHEAGHSMHSYFSNRSQLYQDHGYSIFVAEVASTVNEQLLIAHLRKIHADDRRMCAFLTNHQIDDIKATLFRQVMFSEFEKTVHQLAENNQPLTVEVYRRVYRDLLEKYFGSAVEFGELDDLECFRIPHFYSAFYVYKYATGLISAMHLSQGLLSGDASCRKRYLSFLGSGCSKYPLELLCDAGVDLSSPQAGEHSMQLFAELVKDLESIDLSSLESAPCS